MPGQLQTGTGIGTVVGTDSGEGSIRDHLHPMQTEAGQALAIAALAFAGLLITVGRGQRGMARVVTVGQFVLVILMAEIVGNWAARTWALRHPDAPGAAGISLDI